MDTRFPRVAGAPTPKRNVSASRTAPPKKNGPAEMIGRFANEIKKAVTPREYISTKKENLGITYNKIGPISVIKKGATPESKKKALAIKKSQNRK